MTQAEFTKALQNGDELPGTVEVDGQLVYYMSRDLIREFEPERYEAIVKIMEAHKLTFIEATRYMAYATGIESNSRFW